jgi:hypothetical protein
MSLFPAFIRARKRNNDTAPRPGGAYESRLADSLLADSRLADSQDSDGDDDDNIFDLLPPKPAEAPEPEPQGRNTRPVEMTDLSRLSIDSDGRLYWNGKPVETHHRLSMSRAQIVGAGIVAVFVVIGAIASAIQGTVAARELACRLGWSASACVLPAGQPRTRFDIPA